MEVIPGFRDAEMVPLSPEQRCLFSILAGHKNKDNLC